MLERRQMVISFVHEQEEETRQAAVASQAKHGHWMLWHNVEKRKISWGELWAMDANCIKCVVGAIMMSSQLSRTSVSGWVKTESASCVGVMTHEYIFCLVVKQA